jgi:hypothetical protein
VIRLARAHTCARSATAVWTIANFSAQPRDRVDAPQAGGQPLGNCAQQTIANRVAESVVDGLEPVQIEIQHRQPGFRGNAGQGLLNFFTKELTVRDAGERIVLRHESNERFVFLAFGNVARSAPVSREKSGIVENRIPVILQPVDLIPDFDRTNKAPVRAPRQDVLCML